MMNGILTLTHNEKTLYLLTFSLLIFVSKGICQELRKVNQEAFVPGEQLKYRVHYGFIDAGEATLTVAPALKTVFGKSCYQVTGEGSLLAPSTGF